jgi:hypothetical protein
MPHHAAASETDAIVGWIDTPTSEGIVGHVVRIEGWALARAGIAAVEVRADARRFQARYGLLRTDVAEVHPGREAAERSGFDVVVDVSGSPAPAGVDRRVLTIVAIDRCGRERVLGTRSLIEPAAHARWQFVGASDPQAFHVLPALSGIGRGGAHGLDTWYAGYASATIPIGMRVPILYLRTTRGAAGDYAFDAEFDTHRTNGRRRVVDDALAPLLAHAVAYRLPVLVTLNGGIWSDASGTCTRWDVTDRLEEDVANCQWNERDEVMADDHLGHLPGSHDAPELSRALTLNVHASAVRSYKRRNLQQAAAHLVAFMRAHDALFVGVNLDPDVYINPFFEETQWYDYNPGTLRQFREWLAGDGPYAGDSPDGAPDLREYRRGRPLTLDDVGALAARRFASWAEVEPPRAFSRDPARPFWRDPWVREWEHFRRHLVARHYDELARWLVDAGIPRERIWSSQGLMAPADDAMPLALALDSPVKNSDSAGVCIEGSKPRDGRLGAILYGDAATNTMPMENGKRLYATLARIDGNFGIVEFNTADLRHRERRPSYADAYRALRDLWNAGARLVSPMAWNGANGASADDAGYVPFTAWRNTPLEDATRDFMLARSGLPRGSRLWTVGSATLADDDDWSVDAGELRALPGALALTADANGRIVLVSPPDLDVLHMKRIVLGLDEAIDGTVEIAARREEGSRYEMLANADIGKAMHTSAGVVLGCRAAPIARLRVTFALAPRMRVTLTRVALLQA